MIYQKYFIFFLLIIALLFTISFASSVALAQQSLDNTFTSDASTESVTSTYDAVLKAMLIISQVALIGLIFSHFILQRVIHNNRNVRKKSIGQSVSTSFYHTTRKLTFLLLICCISIIAFSSGIILLSSYELAQNLELEISSAFWIVYSTAVGNVWLLRVVSSLVMIGILMLYRFKIRENINNKTKLNQGYDKDQSQIASSYGKLDWIFFICVFVLGSLNFYSNSMISHSNSLDTFSSLAVSVDWIHFMSVSIWIGGLFYLSILFTKRIFITTNEAEIIDKNILSNFSEKSALEQTTQGLMHFSFIAVTAISIIGITGLYLAFVHLQNLSSLITSIYGQILVIKLSLAFPMIFIGRYNQVKIYNYAKLISTSNSRANLNAKSHQDLDIKSTSKVFLRKINKSLKIESLLGISVLVAASFLSTTSPPSLDSLNYDLTSSDLNGPSSNDLGASNMTFLYLVIILSVIIMVFGIVNFRKNQKQVKEIVSISTTQMDND